MHRRTITSLLIGAVLALIIFPQPASAATMRHPTASYFGMHYSNAASSWPAAPIGSLRIWDNGVSWREIEPLPGVWSWNRLDTIVANARAHGASVCLTLGQTPQWAALYPNQGGSVYGTAAASPPAMAAWKSYVSAVARRYGSRIGCYELWNEFDLGIYWQGTARQMLALAQAARPIIKAANRSAKLIAPSITIRSHGSQLKLFAYAEMGGLRYADAVSLHAYPDPNSGPERSVQLINQVRNGLARRGVHLPIWNTEVNFGLPWGGTGMRVPLTSNQQAAFLVRNLLLDYASGVSRQYWYSWGAPTFEGVQTTTADGQTPSASGRAYAVARHWMRGSVGSCTHNRAGTYHCQLSYAHGSATVYWNPTRTVTVSAPRGSRFRAGVLGVRTAVHGGQHIRVGYSPVLIAR